MYISASCRGNISLSFSLTALEEKKHIDTDITTIKNIFIEFKVSGCSQFILDTFK